MLYQQKKAHETVIWGMLDNRILITGDRLRTRYGPMMINDWYTGGRYDDRGYRSKDYGSDTGSSLSQHYSGRALDLIPRNTTVDEIRNDILDNPFDPTFEYITCIEMDVPWLHVDCRNWNKKKFGILKIYPKTK